MRKLILVAGLPCSGKSYYGKKLAEELAIPFIDDPTDFFMDVAVYFSGCSDLIIADCNFCRKEIREAAMRRITKENPDIVFSWIFFENNQEKCLKNMIKRIHEGDDRKVEGSIKMLSKQYDIPEGAKVLKIWQMDNH